MYSFKEGILKEIACQTNMIKKLILHRGNSHQKDTERNCEQYLEFRLIENGTVS